MSLSRKRSVSSRCASAHLPTCCTELPPLMPDLLSSPSTMMKRIRTMIGSARELLPRQLLNSVHVLLLGVALCVGWPLSAAEPPTQAQLNFFEKNIRPVLVERCYECHSEMSDDIGGSLRVDLRAGLLQGGDTGPAVVPGTIEDSLLIAALEYRDGLEMPPDEPLPANVIQNFKRWIRMGAPDPRSGSMGVPASERPTDADLADSLWSLQPVADPPLPPVQHADWPVTGIDHFLLARMEQASVTPNPPTAPATLLRRVSFDLVGLPPDVDALEAFVADPTDEAYARYVDTLLDSPQFGERWARHWFDIARYGESAGSSRDVLMPYAWRYRDYVIDSINADIPYDRFVTEQIAGDLLEADSPAERQRLLIATGLLAIGSKSLNGGNLTLDIIDDQIDVIGKAVLGMTISCARCHDHKFDPIPTADYYALAGIFKSTQTYYGGSTNRPKNITDELKVYLPLGDDQAIEAAQEFAESQKTLAQLKKKQGNSAKTVKSKLAALPSDWKEREKELNGLLAEVKEDSPLTDEQLQFQKQLSEYRDAQRAHRQLLDEIKELESIEAPELEWAVGVVDDNKIVDSPIHIRGEPKKTGDVVPRGFLSAVSLETSIPEIPNKQSGRRELAAWLVAEDQPLTPRVAVNRIWMHLFGKGLVESVDNFGTTSSPPTHPQLLDHLAYRFVHEHHWSRKALIREIVLSKAYRVAATPDVHSLAVDEANQWYWRRDRRRLEAEPLRDAMLQASGELKLDRPYASIVTQIGEGEVGRGIKDELLNQPYPYRSVYLPVIRGLVPEFLKVFDFPEPSNPQGTRMATNVPAQSLFLMNSPFVIKHSEMFAKRLLSESSTDEQRIDRLYKLTVSRSPNQHELTNALRYLQDFQQAVPKKDSANAAQQAAWATLCQAVFASAEFRYID